VPESTPTELARLVRFAETEMFRLQGMVDAKKVDLAAIKLNVRLEKIRELTTLLNLSVPSASTNVSGLGRLLFNPSNASVIVNLADKDVGDIAAATGVTVDQVLAYVDSIKKKPVLPSTVLKFIQGIPVTPTDFIAEIKAAQTLAGSSINFQDLQPPPPPPPSPGAPTYSVVGLPDKTKVLYGPVNELATATAWMRANLATLNSIGWQLVDSNGVQYASGQPPPPPPPPPLPTGFASFEVLDARTNAALFTGASYDQAVATAKSHGSGTKVLGFPPLTLLYTVP
jgi:hypothetical protein